MSQSHEQREYEFVTKEMVDAAELVIPDEYTYEEMCDRAMYASGRLLRIALKLLRERDAYREGWIKAEMRWDSFIGVPFSQESVARDVAAATIDILTGAEGDTPKDSLKKAHERGEYGGKA